jgi:hypothetical protein
MQLVEKYGLAVEKRIYGRWSGREDGLSYQDMLILGFASVRRDKPAGCSE